MKPKVADADGAAPPPPPLPGGPILPTAPILPPVIPGKTAPLPPPLLQPQPVIIVPKEESKKAPAWKTLLSGGIAGSVSRTATAPLERLKILFQLSTMTAEKPKYTGVFDAVRTISREEGIWALWKGNGVNVLRIAPYSGIGFFAFDRFFRILAAGDPENLAWRRVLAGGMAGACASSATYPLDLVRTRLTLQGAHDKKYRGILHALISVARIEGPLALYKGIGTTLVGIIPYNAINFATFDSVQHFVRGNAPKLSSVQALWVGAFSGAVAATATYPLDLLRRRMQMRSELGGPKVYAGFFDAVVKIWAKEGPVGFFRGLIPCYLKVIPSNAIGFAVYDLCKRVFKFESGSAPSGG